MSGNTFGNRRSTSAVECQSCFDCLEGYRYKCVTCEDYVQCMSCERKHRHFEHFMIRIPTMASANPLGDIFSKMVGRELLEPMRRVRHVDSGQVHHQVRCASCKQVPVGYRYKCVTCDDYDLCAACQGNNIHAEHLMIRVPKPNIFRVGEFEEILIKTMKEAEAVGDDRMEVDPPLQEDTGVVICKSSSGHHYNLVNNAVTHSTVNTGGLTFAECTVCRRLSKANHVLEPCGHRPACENCSEDMTQCPICKSLIVPISQAHCMVCSKVSADNHVLPCKHAPACENCSATMTECLICEVVIKRAVPIPLAQCMVCSKVSAANHVLLCEHAPACEDCSATMTECLICEAVYARPVPVSELHCAICARVYTVIHVQPCEFAGTCENCSPSNIECHTCEAVIARSVPVPLAHCMVCSKVSAANHVLPCKHAPACENCSATMTVCLVCDAVIERPLTKQDFYDPHCSRAGASSGTSGRNTPREQLHYVDLPVDVEVASNCLNCSKKNTTFFQCGHSACRECASRSTMCSRCRQKAVNVIKNDELLYVQAPQYEPAYEECLVCSKLSEVNGTLQPCGHKPACEDCSATLTECLICNTAIGRGRMDEDFGPRLRLILSDQATDESASRCSICRLRKITAAFRCGHGACCPACAARFANCPECKMNINEENGMLVQAAKEPESLCMICQRRENSTNFECGHGACTSCAAQLSNCPACKISIDTPRCDSPGTVTLEARLWPCGHRPACESCSAVLAVCLICNTTVEGRLPKDFIEHRPQLGGLDQAVEKSNSICGICRLRKNITSFRCGHGACPDCAAQLSVCHVCNMSSIIRKTESVVKETVLEESAECMLCCKISRANRVLDLCGHAPACQECSVGLTDCIICDLISEVRLQKRDPTVPHRSSVGVEGSGGEPPRERARDVSALCPNCGKRPCTIVFLCGHSACSKCATRLTSCHTCRKKIAGGEFIAVPQKSRWSNTECNICGKETGENCLLQPCGHRPACENCSAAIRKCLFCNKTINVRYSPDNRIVNYSIKKWILSFKKL